MCIHTHIHTCAQACAFLLVVLDGQARPMARISFLLLARNQSQTAEQLPSSSLRGQRRERAPRLEGRFLLQLGQKGACERLEACKCCSGRRPLVEGQGRRTKPAPSCHMGRLCKEEAESQFNTSSVVCIESPAQRFLPRADHAALCQVVSWALGQTRPLCCHSPCGAPGTNHESQHSAMKGSRAVL